MSDQDPYRWYSVEELIDAQIRGEEIASNMRDIFGNVKSVTSVEIEEPLSPKWTLRV